MRRLLALFLLFLAALLPGCLGGATETETGAALIQGETAWPDGRPAVGVRVRLRPAAFPAGSAADPGSPGSTIGDTVTDERGRYAFTEVLPGEYRVEALYTEGLGASARFRIASGTRALKLDPLVLRFVRSVHGRVRFSDSTLGAATVQVLGTDHRAEADSATGLFTLPDLPPGAFDFRVSTGIPFFPARVFADLAVPDSSPARVGDLVLVKESKQDFGLAGGRLVFTGVDGSNPVLYDNDFSFNTWDNEFVWALASLGRVDLRGNLATRILRDTLTPMPEEFSRWAREAEICRLSGMRNIPETVLGATRKLTLPGSGRWQDIVPETNPGIRLVVAEARKASREKPLVVVVGGPLTTVASALLLDPSIADRLVVFGAYPQDRNGKDSLASYVVAKRGRFVAWGRDYRWSGPAASASPLPGNWLGLGVAASRDTLSPQAAFFDDFGALAFLVDSRAWKGARGAQALSPPLNASLGGAGPFDFVDIPLEANDWGVMDRVFFSVLGDSAAYHPWPVPGTVPGMAFRNRSGGKADSVPGEGDVLSDIGREAWADYALEVAADGTYDLVLRNRCDSAARVEIRSPQAATPVVLDLPADKTWGESRARLSLKKGRQMLRLSTVAGSWRLGRMRWDAVP